jgi:hypothetical protein
MNSEIVKGKPVDKLYGVIAIIIGVTVLLGLLGQWIIVAKDAPLYVIVYVDEKTGIYYAPPYIDGKKYPADLDVSNIKSETLLESRQKNHKLDSTCSEIGYFKTKNTLSDTVFVAIGMMHPSPSRWNPDGSWNW